MVTKPQIRLTNDLTAEMKSLRPKRVRADATAFSRKSAGFNALHAIVREVPVERERGAYFKFAIHQGASFRYLYLKVPINTSVDTGYALSL